MQFIFLFILGSLARLIIRIHKPYVIGVTGTVGKTTISTSVAKFLEKIYGEGEVQISPYHYNGEFGLPLSIIGTKTGGRNPFKWILIFFIALSRCFWRFPKYLILEYGIDHPGEMDFLLSIVIPDIAIISPVAPNHLEQFGTLELYRKEKILLMHSAKYAIIHESLRPFIEKDAVFYGAGGMSEIDASHFEFRLDGVSANIHVKKDTYSITLPSFGAYQVENILPVYGIAKILGIDLNRISEFSSIFTPEVGRSSLLQGIHGSTIIDGSYNGGFESICKGIDSILPFLPRFRVLFFLGDMRELGSHESKIHQDLANFILEKIHPEYNVYFFFVGPLMKRYVEPIVSEKFTVASSLSSRNLGIAIKKLLQEDKKPTVIYVKGSQNTIFLEEGIKCFLDSVSDSSFLCRQSPEWLKKKDIFFENINKSGNSKS